MKPYRTSCLLTVVGALLLSLLTAGARADVASSIAAGRRALIDKNVDLANQYFRAAVGQAPVNQEANALYGMTRIAALNSTPEVQAILSKLGFAKTGRNLFDWAAGPARPLTSKLASDEVEAALLSKLVPELQLADQNLASVSDPAFTLNLSASETHGVAVTIDYGDILLMRSLAKAAICTTHLYDSIESNLVVSDIAKLALTNGLTLQRILGDKPNLLTFEPAAAQKIGKAVAAYRAGVDLYESAIGFIRARPDSTARLFTIDPASDAEETAYREHLIAVQESLRGVTTFDPRTQVNASAYVSNPTAPRALLPNFKSNGLAPGATIPDPTFGGVLPGLSQERAVEFFTKLKATVDRAFRFRDDPNPPSLVITGPKGATLFDAAAGNTVTIKGTAKDDVAVAKVSVSYQGTVYPATLSGSNPREVKWEVTIPAEPGLVSISAAAYDAQPNSSKVSFAQFTFLKNTQLTVATTGQGTVDRKSGPYPIHLRTTFNAKPAKGFIFTGWYVTNGLGDRFFYGPSPKLDFSPLDEPTLTLTAEFIPNPFPALVGTYNTLLTEYDPETTQTFTRGILSLTLGAGGTFTYKGFIYGNAVSGTAFFTPDGVAQFTLGSGFGTLFINLYVDFEDGTVSISTNDFFGTSNANGEAARVAPSTTTSPLYTAVFRTLDQDSFDLPAGLTGTSFAIFTRGKTNDFRIVGTLADGTPFSVGATVNDIGNGVYAPIYVAYANEGLLSGEIVFGDASAPELSGTLNWSSTGGPGLFSDAFDVFLEVAGAPFTPAPPKRRLAPLNADGAVSFSLDGNTGTVGDDVNRLTQDLRIAPTGKATAVLPNDFAVKLNLVGKTGLFAGTYLDPDDGSKRTFTGVLVQPASGVASDASAEGFSLRAGLSDRVTLFLAD